MHTGSMTDKGNPGISARAAALTPVFLMVSQSKLPAFTENGAIEHCGNNPTALIQGDGLSTSHKQWIKRLGMRLGCTA